MSTKGGPYLEDDGAKGGAQEHLQVAKKSIHAF